MLDLDFAKIKQKMPHSLSTGLTKVKFQSYLTAFFKITPALNLGTFEALILISLPVAGLRPVRAARLATSNVPKPVN